MGNMYALLALFLAAVLLASSVGKARDLHNFSSTLELDLGVPSGLVLPSAAIVLAIEAGTAGLLLLGNPRFAMGLAVILFVGFTVTVAVSALRGADMQCRCFGSEGERVGPVTIVRNLLLTSAAIYGLAIATTGPPPPLSLRNVVLIGPAVGLAMAVVRTGDVADAAAALIGQGTTR